MPASVACRVNEIKMLTFTAVWTSCQVSPVAAFCCVSVAEGVSEIGELPLGMLSILTGWRFVGLSESSSYVLLP